MKLKIVLATVTALVLSSCGNAPPNKEARDKRAANILPAVEPSEAPSIDGVAIMLVVDVSGSMSGDKLSVAKRCLTTLAAQTVKFAMDNKDKKVLLGICAFSSSCTEALPIGQPDFGKATAAIEKLSTGGGTAIGDAMLFAKKKLDSTKFKKIHILIITDGENTSGEDPSVVVQSFSKLPPEKSVGTYLIGFDVATSVYEGVKEAGGLVLSAANEAELKQTTEYVLSNKVLAEALEPEPKK